MSEANRQLPDLSIAIKCYNEQAKIETAISTAEKAARRTAKRFEIVIADSLSADHTRAKAVQYDVRFVEIASAYDRGCGAATQLSYQCSKGAYVYLMDGDMALHEDFLVQALEYLEENSEIAGVGGLLSDTRIRNVVDKIRSTNKPSAKPGPVEHLAGGGLYRRKAIESAGGYIADRNLKALEEAELGMRLRAAGWKLMRLNAPAVQHDGHDLDTWRLLAKHWRSGRAMAGGVLLKGALGHKWILSAVRLQWHPLLTLVWWLIVAPTVLVTQSLAVAFCVVILPWILVLIAQALRKKSIEHAFVSLVHWHYGAVATLVGLMHQYSDPSKVIRHKIIKNQTETRGSHSRYR